MASHDETPVALDGSKDEAVDSFLSYLVHREEVEGTKRGALSNDHKAFRTLCDLVGIDRQKLPTAPTPPGSNERDIPSPEDVYDLLHAKYLPGGDSNPENQLVRYLLAFSFESGAGTPTSTGSRTTTRRGRGR